MSADAPRAIAIIPARGGSKRVPGKNLLPLAGRPLVAHSVLHARESRYVETVYVSTDDSAIAEVAQGVGAEVIERSPELAGDKATSESALLEVLDARVARGLADPDLVVFLQCTSPVRRPGEVDRAVEKLLSENADSLISVAEDAALLWHADGDAPRAVNWDSQHRPREQELAHQYRENGSIYVFRPAVLREHGNRLGGRIALHVMDFWSSFQLDKPADRELLEWIIRRPGLGPPVSLPDPLEMVLMDFDGVLTDNRVIVSQTGEESVRCDRSDGWGIARLRDAGVLMAVVSTEANPVVQARCEKLQLACHQDVSDKRAFVEGLLKDEGIAPSAVAYVGNDVNDLEVMDLVGLAVAPCDSHPDVLAAADLVLARPGGKGAVREFCDHVLRRASASA